jgi:hypothetical protein
MIRRVLAPIAILALLAACEQVTDPPIPTALQLTHSSVSLHYGQTVRVIATILDQDGEPVLEIPQGYEILWTSANPNVAVVDDGWITGTGAGSTTVTATAGGLQKQVQVTVTNAPTALTVEPATLSLQPGQSAPITAVVVNESGAAFATPPQGFEITWSSANASVATVNDGTVTAVAAGTTSIRVQAGTLPAKSVSVQVATAAPSPRSIVVTPSTVALVVGQNATVTARLYDAQGAAIATPPPGYEITWSSSQPSIATVQNGIVTGVAAGQATVTARAGSLTPAAVQVQVAVPAGSGPVSISVSPSNVALKVGENATVTATLRDAQGAPIPSPPPGYQITWSSSHPSVATVQNGVITGVGAGQTTVTANAGSLPPATVQVQVTPKAAVTAQIAFSYSGDRSGSFDVQTAFDPDDIEWEGTWAFTLYDSEYDDQDIMAQRRRDNGLVDFAWFWVDGRVTATGTRTITGGVLVLGFDLDDESAEAEYDLTSGSITHTSVTATRMGGTFTMTMVEENTGAALNITGGTFDLPLLDESQVYGEVTGSGGAPNVALPEGLRRMGRAWRLR